MWAAANKWSGIDKRLAALETKLAAGQIDPDIAEENELLEGSLIDFVEAAWPSVDTSEYQQSWAIDALCDHLQAVSDGEIKRLLVNFPPRCGKTNITSICFPSWVWARSERSFVSGDRVRFLRGSYNDKLSWGNATKHMRLITSPWFQRHWGGRFKLMMDQHSKYHFDLNAGGGRISVTTRGGIIGFGGDIIIVDDPHSTEGAESAAERENAAEWWKEMSSTRLNSPKDSAIVVIMQRLHEEDVSGLILSGEENWTHLCIPMEYDPRRHSQTTIGWNDPRGCDEDGEPLVDPATDLPRDDEAARILYQQRAGMLMWPERFGPAEVQRIKSALGPYMASGRLQQMPVPEKGGIFQRDWWQLWSEPTQNLFPACDFVVASLDGAFTSKEENDPSGMTVWGCFEFCKTCNKSINDYPTQDGLRDVCGCGRRITVRRIILMQAWRKFLKFSGPRIDRRPNESNAAYVQRTQPDWGLVEWVAHTCARFGAHKLLIEAKASGISAAQELQNRYGEQPWAIQLVNPKGDKVARALATQPTFAQGLVFAPDKAWAELVIEEMAAFPKAKHDDLCDSATQAINYLRSTGLARTDVEIADAEHRAGQYRPRKPSIYPA